MNTHKGTSFRSVVLAATLLLAASFAGASDIKGKVAAPGMRSPANIVVYVDAIPGKTFPPPAQHAVMDQVHLAFSPHVLVVLKGTTVDFLNEDSVGHNVYWPAISHDKKLAHNMGTWPQGIKKSLTFDNLGDVPLLCNVHPDMSGYIIVTPTPYHALTGPDGSFEIKDVPAGQYTLKTWSEEAKPTTQAVTVGAGTSNVSLSVKK